MDSTILTQKSRRTQILRSRYVYVGLLLLAYIIVIGDSSAIGLGDAPNHLVRAYIMADLIFHHGAVFGSQFQYHFQAVPYALPDLLLTPAVEVFGPRLALAAWTIATFLSIPAALLLYFRVTSGANGISLLKDEGALFLLLCSLYLSTDLFFVLGFFAFKLGVACVILILTLVELLRRRWSNGLFILYCALVAAAYLVHLSTLLFLATILAVSAAMRLWLRSSSLRHELFLFAPILAMLAWHFGVAVHYHRPTDLPAEKLGYFQDDLGRKMEKTIFERYGGRLDRVLRWLYVLGLLILIRGRASRDAFAIPRVIESLAIAVIFFAMYLVLPFSYSGASYVDDRMLAPATLLILLAGVQLPRRESVPEISRHTPSLAVVLAFILATLNLAYLGKRFIDLANWSTKYREVFAAIPRGARVLPVNTVRAIYRFMEPSAITVIDRQAFFPYLYSGNTGQSMTYFRYIDLPYTPDDNWYMQGPPLVDWHRVGCTYQYILVTRPFDPEQIRVATKPVAQTSSVVLLAIDPRACSGS